MGVYAPNPFIFYQLLKWNEHMIFVASPFCLLRLVVLCYVACSLLADQLRYLLLYEAVNWTGQLLLLLLESNQHVNMVSELRLTCHTRFSFELNEWMNGMQWYFMWTCITWKDGYEENDEDAAAAGGTDIEVQW